MNLFMVEISVRDIGLSLPWYRDVLKLGVLLEDEPKQFVLLQGQTGGRVALKGQADTASVNVRLHFQVADLAEELARIAELNVTPEDDVKISAEGYRRAVIRDPDHNPITLFEWLRK